MQEGSDPLLKCGDKTCCAACSSNCSSFRCTCSAVGKPSLNSDLSQLSCRAELKQLLGKLVRKVKRKMQKEMISSNE